MPCYNVCERISSKIIGGQPDYSLGKNIVRGVKDICFTRVDFLLVVACS